MEPSENTEYIRSSTPVDSDEVIVYLENPDPEFKVPDYATHWEEGRAKSFTDEDQTEAWSKMADTVRAYSDDLVERWNGEIDALLTYAGLFSAILTAFNVQSYPLLVPSSPDPVLATLQQISTQMKSFSVNPPFVNATTTPAIEVPATPPTEPWVIWLNALWFSSLICSLSAASIGIMVKQWISQYKSGLYGNSRQIARLRQQRLDNLLKWHVAEIVAILPVLLQAGLVLFFAGLLVLLWQLDGTVSIVASSLIGALLAFTLITTILPSFARSCCYLSPQSLAVFFMKRYMGLLLAPMTSHIGERIKKIPVASGLITSWRKSAAQGAESVVQWLRTRLIHIGDYRRLELSHVEASSAELDLSTLAHALPAIVDHSIIDSATACFTDLTPDQVLRCFRAFAEHHQPIGESLRPRRGDWIHKLPLDLCSDVLVALECASPETLQAYPGWIEDVHSIISRLDVVSPMGDASRLNLLLLNLSVLLKGHSRAPDNVVDITSALHDPDAQRIYLREMRHRLSQARDGKIPMRCITRQYIASVAQDIVQCSDNGKDEDRFVGMELLLGACIVHDSATEKKHGRLSGLAVSEFDTRNEVEAIREIQRTARETFTAVLTKIPATTDWMALCVWWDKINVLLDIVRVYGERAGLIDEEVVAHLVRRLDFFECMSPGTYIWANANRQWIRTLQEEHEVTHRDDAASIRWHLDRHTARTNLRASKRSRSEYRPRHASCIRVRRRS